MNDVSTEAQMTAYENIFGPAARDIKFDTQRNKRHQRWHLPDALRGPSAFLTDRVDGLITDATSSPFTKNILPYKYLDQPDRKIKWNVYHFDEGVASRVPYESAARVLPQSKQSFSGYAVRQGLAIAMEHNFMMSPAGLDNFRKQLQQLVGSIQMTNDLDVHMALLLAPSYQKQMDEKYYDNSVTTVQHCRMYIDLFGFMAKNDNALDFLIEDAKNHLETWGSKPPTFMLCNRGLTKGLTMNPEKTMYATVGPDGKQKLAAGPELPSYRGLNFISTRKFSLDTGTAPRDLLRRRVRVAEHYRIAWEETNFSKRYEFYDQSRDSMVYLSWTNLWEASMPTFNNEGKLRDFLDHMEPDGDPDVYENVQLRVTMQDLFLEVCPQGGDGMNLDFAGFWKIGAMLGFWKNSAPVQGQECPQFCKQRFECVTFDSDGSVVDQCIILISQNPTNEQALAYALIAILFIKNAINQSKHNLIDEVLTVANFEQVGLHTRSTSFQAPTHRNNKRTVYPCDLFILRPNIEHYMLGIIFGRGGGPEELGATFWGQTELSVYDDTQHGIWGMSYKYHERAIVTNDRNLVRVFDVAFDGYTGGNDSRIMKWERDEILAFESATKDVTKPYAGPSMLVFALPPHNISFESFPNPVVFFPTATSQEAHNAMPDRSARFTDLARHSPFAKPNPECSWTTEGIHEVYKTYFNLLNPDEWKSTSAMAGNAGQLACADETSMQIFSFHGHMSVSDGARHETVQGTGHLGHSYVGVASVREGRGLLQTARQAVMQKL